MMSNDIKKLNLVEKTFVKGQLIAPVTGRTSDRLNVEVLSRLMNRRSIQSYINTLERNGLGWSHDNSLLNRIYSLPIRYRYFINLTNGFFRPSSFELGLSRLIELRCAGYDLVLEISESHYNWLHRSSYPRVLELKRNGFNIALDDYVHNSKFSLPQFNELQPNYVKISGSSLVKMELSQLRDYAHLVRVYSPNCEIICEGVANITLLTKSLSFDIDHVQGFLVHKPSVDILVS